MKRPSSLLILAGLILPLGLATSGCRSTPLPTGPRAETGTAAATQTEVGLTGGTLLFSDDFNREQLGDAYDARTESWSIRDGWIHVERAHNDALWLKHPLPDRVRIEFQARSLHPSGDLKFEVFGDGRTHESGYICIFGGWNNRLNIIARRDEHGDDRLVGADGVRVEQNRIYQFALVRTDNRVRWYVDGEPFLTFDDAEPLRGELHRFFGFNNWEVPLQFDDLRIFDLGPA